MVVARSTSENEHRAYGAIRLSRVLSKELFLHLAGVEHDPAGSRRVAELCHARWTDLAAALTALPTPLEFYVVASGHAGGEMDVTNERFDFAYLPVGRGRTVAAARRAAGACGRALGLLLSSTLDYAELHEMTDADAIESLVSCLEAPSVRELRRRREFLRVGHSPVPWTGLRRKDSSEASSTRGHTLSVSHLFPWIPSDDTWQRLIDVLLAIPSHFVVHVRTWPRTPTEILERAHADLAEAERVMGASVETHRHRDAETWLPSAAAAVREQTLRRVSELAGGTLGIRVFLTGRHAPEPAMISAARIAIDDASRWDGREHLSLFAGGCVVKTAASRDVLDDMPADAQTMFGVREACAVLRTPMPTEADSPGLMLNRSRTSPLLGRAGNDVTLGSNLHRGRQVGVAMDRESRFRHTYIIGQTGTGKSTLMLRMILEDIRLGRGVAVLDPHGALIEEILRNYPEERRHDLVIVDPSDHERPVGLNFLKIDEPEPMRYRRARDMVIDDLYHTIDLLYDLKVTGGPIFESHFRGMLTLLMGHEQPGPRISPTLMMFRALYTNAELRKRKANEVRGKDPIIDDFLREIELASRTSDASIDNMATYITSKFVRFVSDESLRNMVCQDSMLDIASIIRRRKVLLFDLAKGRFGDLAAGLLAGQFMSRIRHAVMSRGAESGQSPFYLYADEFQLFADDRFAELLAEARKFGLALTMAHQFANQLPPRVLNAILGNVGTVVTLRLGPQDAELLEPIFRPHFSHRDLTSLSNFRAYVRGSGTLGHAPFSLDLPTPPQSEADDPAMSLRAYSRMKYGRARDDVEIEIREN
ncbi:MAG: type IV secretion system DNA-binding domain-containing protein [Deltaproteobacteria bacterium]|nr:type IV secretion system DNA-binding domain-containing protein [Deltaproteobacteria bacterium]